MAKVRKKVAGIQPYPRIKDEDSKFVDCLDESKLVPHFQKLPKDLMKTLIKESIKYANSKSSKDVFVIPDDADNDEILAISKKTGQEIFKYFRKYCSDPAVAAQELFNKHYHEVCTQAITIKKIQMQRMNSGWMYQRLAYLCALASERFSGVIDIGMTECDMAAIIECIDTKRKPISLFVSIKNRGNTMGGQDWPGAIEGIERLAAGDKNRPGPYCCVFGITMDKGERLIKRRQKTGQPLSYNTEVWKSNFFWPFFTNYSYEEIMALVLETLDEIPLAEIPDLVFDTFENMCREKDLINKDGFFNNSKKLVSFFCT